MIKLWSDDQVQFAYEHLCVLWRDRAIPEYWRWRWIAPIPKKDEPELEELRPITLIEALRKIWISLFIRRFQNMWDELGTLNSGQHGFLRKRGTDSAIVEVLNALEAAKEAKSPICMSSWDKKRAFDSVAKQVLVFSWIRLGVPVCLAQYIVAMDDGGHSVVRSPLAYTAMRSHGRAGVRERGLDFIARRGAGQGDVPSPLNWVAFYDILLDALEEVGGETYTQSTRGINSKASDSAYADDLFTKKARMAALQQQADVISAFCIVFGIRLSLAKFRSFVLTWGNERRLEDCTLQIHEAGWVPRSVEVLRDGTITYLGVQIDMELSNKTALAASTEVLEVACTRIAGRCGTAESKALVVRKSIMEKIAYGGKFMSWSLKEFESLDKILAGFYKKITGCRAAFPEELVFLPRRLLGLGMERLSTLCQSRKLSLVYRLSQGLDVTRNHIHGLLERGLRADNMGLTPHAAISDVGRPMDDIAAGWFSTSLRESLALNGLHLRVNGETTNEGDAAIAEWAQRAGRRMDTAVSDRLSIIGVATRGELLAGDEGSDEVADRLGLDDIDNVRVRSLDLGVRPGQCWTSQGSKERGEFMEVLGFIGDHVQAVRWWSPTGQLQLGVKCRQGPEDEAFSRGSGGGISLGWDYFLSGEMYLVVTSGDRHRSDLCNELEVLDIKLRHPCRRSGEGFPQDLRDLIEWGRTAEAIYTDGSWTNTSTFADRMMGRHNHAAAVGLARRDPDGSWHGLRVVCRSGQHESAFTVEALGQALALGMRRDDGGSEVAIYSDCEAALKSLRKVRAGNLGNHDAAQLLAAMAMTRGGVTKIAAHPERRGRKESWAPDDWGSTGLTASRRVM
jgi:hypothetical protein